ncbi:TAP-like protein-domain-containing protein [Xylariaceae sp. FL0255]|nr:TAP-like protein-domain-containing protein [Xylariaceae sp. FL0255]
MFYFEYLSTAPAVLSLMLAASATTRAGSVYPIRPSPSGVQWGSCPDDLQGNSTLKVECGTLAVPLDYTSPNKTDTLDLSPVKVPAVKGPANHSILFNFGGPGLEARYTLAGLSDTLMAITGGEHDLIGWDPRGTAETLTFSCFADEATRTAIEAQSVLGNSSDVAHGQVWAASTNYDEACAEYTQAQERGPLIGTTFTVRDAMQIVDAVESDGLLRYWGFSYGSVIGATLAAMFPDRVEKVVIDGVLNPIEYFYAHADFQQFAGTDAAFAEFFRQCVSTPKDCVLAQNYPNETAAQLEAATYNLIEEVKYQPIAIEGAILGYDELQEAIRFLGYSPKLWLSLVSLLDVLLAEPRNETDIISIITSISNTLGSEFSGANDSPLGIECGDKKPRTASFDVISEVFEQLQSVSRLQGDSTVVVPATSAQWPFEPRERYEGRFVNVKPRKPLLVIGNTYDPATSFQSAQNISETIKGSVLLQHGGFGHASINQPSLCTALAIQNYFRNGTLPTPNTLCPPTEPPFQYAVSGSWDQLYAELGFHFPGNSSASSRAKRGNMRSGRKIGNFYV